MYNAGDGQCVSSFASADDATLEGVTVPFLGLQFFENVVGVFDFGKNETRFAA